MLKLVIAFALVAIVAADVKQGIPASASFSASKETVDCCPAASVPFAKDGLKCGDTCYNGDTSACWSGTTKNTATDQSGSNVVVCAKNNQVACGHNICMTNARTATASSFGDSPNSACHADTGSCFAAGSTTKLAGSGGSTEGEVWCTSGTAKRCGLQCLPASGSKCITSAFAKVDTDASVDSIVVPDAAKRCGSFYFTSTQTCWNGLTKTEHTAVTGEGIAGDLICPKDYLRCGGKVSCLGVIAGFGAVSSNAGAANWCFKSDNAKCFTSASDTAGQTTSSNAEDAFACLNTQKRCGGQCIPSGDTCTVVGGLSVRTTPSSQAICGEEVITTTGTNLSCQDGKVCYPNQGVSTCRCRDPIAKQDCPGLKGCGCTADGSSASTAAASGIAAILAAAGAMMN